MIYNGKTIILPTTAKKAAVSEKQGAGISDIPQTEKVAENAEEPAETKSDKKPAEKKPKTTTAKTATRRKTK